MYTRRDQCLFALKIATCLAAIFLCGFLSTTVDAQVRVRGPVVVRLVPSNTCLYIPKGKSRSPKYVHEGVDPTLDVFAKKIMSNIIFRVRIRFHVASMAKSSQLCRFVKMKISGSTERYNRKAVSMIRAMSEEELASFVDWNDMGQQNAFAVLMREKFSTFNRMFGLEIRSAFFERSYPR